MITIVIGLSIGQMTTIEEFGMMMTGFLLALLAQRFMFRDAELKSEVVTGLILLLAALLINMTQHTLAATFISSTFVGMATGIVGTRFLLFFIASADTASGEPRKARLCCHGRQDSPLVSD